MFAKSAITLLRSRVLFYKYNIKAPRECLAHRTWMHFWQCSTSYRTVFLSELQVGELSPCVCVVLCGNLLVEMYTDFPASESECLCWHVFCSVLLIDVLNSTKVA